MKRKSSCVSSAKYYVGYQKKERLRKIFYLILDKCMLSLNKLICLYCQMWKTSKVITQSIISVKKSTCSLILCTSLLRHPKFTKGVCQPQPYPVVEFILGSHSDVPQHSQGIDSRFLIDGSSPPWKHNHPPFCKDHFVRTCSGRQGGSRVLRASFTNGSGLLEKVHVDST